MNLTIGILAIGSLYWGNNVRDKWRQSRLKKDDAVSVTAPIRYGRLSNSNTYTMVFSSSVKEPERAKAIPCINNVTSVPELVYEAELLWAAERSAAKSNNRLSGSTSSEPCWGCVGLLTNPNIDIPDDLLKGWAGRIAQEQDYGRLQHTDEEKPVISDQGLLQISWPDLADGSGPLPLHLLLATANNPTLTGTLLDYPSPEVIANAWNTGSETYPSEKPDR